MHQRLYHCSAGSRRAASCASLRRINVRAMPETRPGSATVATGSKPQDTVTGRIGGLLARHGHDGQENHPSGHQQNSHGSLRSASAFPSDPNDKRGAAPPKGASAPPTDEASSLRPPRGSGSIRSFVHDPTANVRLPGRRRKRAKMHTPAAPLARIPPTSYSSGSRRRCEGARLVGWSAGSVSRRRLPRRSPRWGAFTFLPRNTRNMREPARLRGPPCRAKRTCFGS
jgi:hypothetical protein